MIIYYINYTLIILLGAIQYFKFKDNKKAKVIYLFVCGLILLFISGWRYGIGFDYFAYANIFEKVCKSSWSELIKNRSHIGASEPLFLIFAKVVSLFSTHVQALYIASTILFLVLVFGMIYKYSKVPFVSVLMFVTLNYFYSGMNLLRYTLSAVICFTAYKFLLKSKMDYSKENLNFKTIKNDLIFNFLPYAGIILIAGLVHKSALIMLPIYFIVKIKFNINTQILYLALTTVACIIIKPLTTFFSQKFFNGSYDYVENGIFTRPGGWYYLLIPAIILIMIIILNKKIIEKDKNNIVLINMAIYSFVIYFVASFFIFIFTRIAFFPYIFMLLLVPEIISTLEPSEYIVNRISELEVKIKNASRVDKNKITKEISGLKKEFSDSKAFSNFAIGFSVVMVLIFATGQSSKGAHKIYPYVSRIDIVNKINRMNLNNDRDKTLDILMSMDYLDRYLFEANDPDYVVFFAVKNEAFADISLYDWRLEQFQNMGLDADFKNKYNYSYVAVVDGGQKVYEELSPQMIEAEVKVGNIDSTIYSDGSMSGFASIQINGKEYAKSKQGLNIVVYDKVLERVVDSVYFTADYYTRDTAEVNR